MRVHRPCALAECLVAPPVRHREVELFQGCVQTSQLFPFREWGVRHLLVATAWRLEAAPYFQRRMKPKCEHLLLDTYIIPSVPN